MLPGDFRRQFEHVFATEITDSELPVEPHVVVELAHADGILDWRAFTRNTWFAVNDCYRNDFEVKVWRPRTIKPYLLFAIVVALREGREVEKSEINRFLDLVRVLAGKKDSGYVCLNELDLADLVRVCGGTEQSFDQVRSCELNRHTTSLYLRVDAPIGGHTYLRPLPPEDTRFLLTRREI